jgi:hypothetical protein
MYVFLSQAANQACADAFGVRLDGKYIVFYSGIQPTSANAALGGGNVKLGQCQLSTPAVNPADSYGKITFNTIAPDVSTDADGGATFARICNSDGSGVEMQCDVGTSNTVIILNTTAFTLGGTVTVNSAALQHHDGV